jgi:hypothetical protein
MGGMGLPGLWLFLALVVAASVFLAVGSVWLATRRFTGRALRRNRDRCRRLSQLSDLSTALSWVSPSSSHGSNSHLPRQTSPMSRPPWRRCIGKRSACPRRSKRRCGSFCVSTPRPSKPNGTVKAATPQATRHEPRLPTCTACLASSNRPPSPPIRSMRRSATNSTS